LFHNANLFGVCIIHILYAGCAKIKKNNSGAKGLKRMPCTLNLTARKLNQLLDGRAIYEADNHIYDQ
jgi:hypothetical protein